MVAEDPEAKGRRVVFDEGAARQPAMVSEDPGAKGRRVVIDAGAAIRLQRLERFGGELFTTSGVLAEVKDEHARALLRTLPQQLNVREPLTQDIAYVKQFAKGTGDLGFLSQNDIELMALTVALHRETGGKLRDRPSAPAVGDGNSAFEWAPGAFDKSAGSSTASTSAPGPAAGVAKPSCSTASLDGKATPAADATADEVGQAQAQEPGEPAPKPAAEPAVSEAAAAAAPAAPEALAAPDAPAAPEASAAEAEVTQDGARPADASASRPSAAAEPAAAEPAAAEQQQPEQDEEDDDASEDGSSAGEWVTPENIHHFNQSVQPDADEARVTCATSDYSMQNVLLQMGITPLTFDGYAVRSVKVWGLICRACQFFTRDTQKIFCPKCGHDTVVRVPIIVDQDGKPTAMNCGRKLRTKGTVYSCPKPTQGRGWKPIFAEDEIKIGGRDRELRHAQKLADKERQAKDPFDEDNGARAWYQRGTTATGRMLGTGMPRFQAGYGRRNPNANNFKFKTTKRR